MTKAREDLVSVTVRMSRQSVDEMKDICTATGWDRAVIVRMAIDDFVDVANGVCSRPVNATAANRVVARRKKKEQA